MVLDYEPDSGSFIWKSMTSLRCVIGAEAGSLDKDGYRRVRLFNKRYQAHRLIWLWMTGSWPVGVIDHIDGNPSNNSWSNLRDVSTQCNQLNQKPSNRRTISGLIGANYDKYANKYLSRIHINGVTYHLGSFDTAEEAHRAYIEAKPKHHGVSSR